MKRTFALLLMSSILLTSAPVWANKDLANSKNCLSCHAQDKKIIGPSIRSIADKYPNADNTKIAQLAKKVREGGVGVWGAIPMSANPQVSEAESIILVKWYLGGGK